MTFPRVRIVNEHPIAGQGTMVLLRNDPDPDDWFADDGWFDATRSLMVTNVDVSLKVGEAARARVECLAIAGEIDAVLDELVVRYVGSSRWTRPFRRAWWRLVRWYWGARVRDVTTAGSPERRYVR